MSSTDTTQLHKRGHIWLDNWWIRNELRTIKTRAAMLVYFVLLSRRNRETHECYPGMKKICSDTGLSRKAASAAVRHLELLGLLTVTQGRWNKTQQWKNNVYTVHDEVTWDSEIRPDMSKSRAPKSGTRAV